MLDTVIFPVDGKTVQMFVRPPHGELNEVVEIQDSAVRANQHPLPINLAIGKTVLWGGRPWKLSVEVNYFVDQPDAFGPEWMFGINVAPVVENVFARMLQ
jgi:hypothetical protein